MPSPDSATRISSPSWLQHLRFPCDLSCPEGQTPRCLLTLAYFSSLIFCPSPLHARASNPDPLSVLCMPIPPGLASAFPEQAVFLFVGSPPTHLWGLSRDVTFSLCKASWAVLPSPKTLAPHTAHHPGLRLFNHGSFPAVCELCEGTGHVPLRGSGLQSTWKRYTTGTQ